MQMRVKNWFPVSKIWFPVPMRSILFNFLFAYCCFLRCRLLFACQNWFPETSFTRTPVLLKCSAPACQRNGFGKPFFSRQSCCCFVASVQQRKKVCGNNFPFSLSKFPIWLWALLSYKQTYEMLSWQYLTCSQTALITFTGKRCFFNERELHVLCAAHTTNCTCMSELTC